MEDDTVWLSQQQIAQLFDFSRTNVVEHIKHIIEDNELDISSTCRKFRQVQIEGKRNVEREVPFYNLDMILSVGYRIRSKIATQFRQWATRTLKSHLVDGYTINKQRLAQLGKVLDSQVKPESDRVIFGGNKQFVPGLDLLDNYDHGAFTKPEGDEAKVADSATCAQNDGRVTQNDGVFLSFPCTIPSFCALVAESAKWRLYA